MKKATTVILILALALTLCACGEKPVQPPAPTATAAPSEAPQTTPCPTDEPSASTPEAFVGPIPGLTRETMPRLDGSTSTVPLGLAVCARLLGETEDAVADLVQFSRTTNSYMHLLYGESDLLIVAEAGQEVFDKKDELGFQWERAPFSTDAFVFVVNEDNPVESITVAQAKQIYTGEITNWKELGGADAPIQAFQRNPGAGSQTLMEKLVMQGTPMMDAPADYIIATMGNLMTAVKAFDGSANAIGYSLYYYAEEMKMAQGLKLLALEGVAPTPETIRSEAYPLVNPNYVVMAADTPADAPARLIYDWLLGPEGQQLVADMGYVSILDLTVTPRVTPSIGARWYTDYTDHLICRDDYGELIPFAGKRLTDVWYTGTGCLYGLMTRDGQVVVDPVYSNVWGSELLVLQEGSVEGVTLPDGGEALPRIAIAAVDGSWCTPFSYNYCVPNSSGLALFSTRGLTLMRYDGSIEAETGFADMGCDQETWDSVINDMYWGIEGQVGERLDDLVALLLLRGDGEYSDMLCYDVATGKVKTVPFYEQWWKRYEEEFLSGEPEPEPDYPIPNAWALYDQSRGKEDYLLKATRAAGNVDEFVYYRADGTPLPELTLRVDYTMAPPRCTLRSGIVEKLELDQASYYDLETMTCIFRTGLGFEPTEVDPLYTVSPTENAAS